MKIYSWNMWFSNPHLDEALKFIKESDFDIFCLQEVPNTFLKTLTALPYPSVYTAEVDRLFMGQTSTQYLVILSRFPICNQREIALPYYEPTLPLRTNLFAFVMIRVGLWGWGRGNRHALYADINTPTGVERIFNVHLPLLAPSSRAEELERIMQESVQGSIVCGDFNILESRRIAVLNYILGGHLSDVLFWKRERRAMEKRFTARGLINPLSGKVTHGISHSQLDHILVPQTAQVIKAEVIADSHGSDHHPIFAEVA